MRCASLHEGLEQTIISISFAAHLFRVEHDKTMIQRETEEMRVSMDELVRTKVAWALSPLSNKKEWEWQRYFERQCKMCTHRKKAFTSLLSFESSFPSRLELRKDQARIYGFQEWEKSNLQFFKGRERRESYHTCHPRYMTCRNTSVIETNSARQFFPLATRCDFSCFMFHVIAWMECISKIQYVISFHTLSSPKSMFASLLFSYVPVVVFFPPTFSSVFFHFRVS